MLLIIINQSLLFSCGAVICVHLNNPYVSIASDCCLIEPLWWSMLQLGFKPRHWLHSSILKSHTLNEHNNTKQQVDVYKVHQLCLALTEFGSWLLQTLDLVLDEEHPHSKRQNSQQLDLRRHHGPQTPHRSVRWVNHQGHRQWEVQC